MITEKEQEKIQLLSDTDLYPEAVEFMRSIGRPIPSTQINGLLNVSLANTYDELNKFVEGQCKRTTWRRDQQHVPDFYRKLLQKLKKIESSIIKIRQEKPSQEDAQALKMLLAREFIQHLLAENAYMGTIRAAQDTRATDNKNQGKPQGNYRGPSTRQGRA